MHEYRLIDNRSAPEPTRIDYPRMQAEWPKQKAALATAVRSNDARNVAAVCVRAVKVWDEIGSWPDDWMLFERTLNDMLHWNQHVSLSDIAYGRTTIVRVTT